MMGFVFLKTCLYSGPMSFILTLLISLQAYSITIVSETVGQVSDYVVTSREVQIVKVIENVLAAEGPVKDLYEVRPGHQAFRTAVTQVLLESVVALEAENFNVSVVTNEQLNAAVSKVEKAVSGKAYWAQIDVSSAELRRFTQRHLLAKTFMKFKTTSMSSIVSDQEAEIYYNKNRAKFGDTSFESFRENIKTFLAQQQLEERLRAWFEVIKRKYKVRNLIAES